MDFLNPSKKRIHAIRLTIGYILIAVAIAIVSLLLLLGSYGYDINRRTGTIYQNGLVFVSAHPVGADILINGEDKGGTDARFTLPAGRYTVELKRNGYSSWKRTFNLEGGSIERLTYPFLFPEKLNTKDVQLYGSSPTLATASPDRHWIIVGQSRSMNTFEVFDASQSNPNPTIISLPDGLFTKPNGPESITLIEWSTDNRHVLLKHIFGSGYEFIMLDRQDPASSFNINKRLNLSPVRITLRDKKHDQFYIYDDKTRELKTADLKNNQIQLLLSGVIDFKSYGSDVVLYVGDDGTVADKVQLKLKEKDKTHLIKYLPISSSYVIDIASFNDNWYVVAGAKSDGFVSIYKNPQDKPKKAISELPVPISVLKLDQASFVSFSANAQFIAAQSGSKFAVYDIENNRRYYYVLPLTLDQAYQAKWMDDHRLFVVQDSQVLVFDYDGINLKTLTKNNAGLEPFFDRDYTAIYNIAPSVTVPGRVALTRTDLRVTH